MAGRAAALKDRVDKESSRTLHRLQKSETRFRSRLAKSDSSKAKELFGDAEVKYANARQLLAEPARFNGYIPALDTLKTSIRFLEANLGSLGALKDQQPQVQQALSKVSELEGAFQGAEQLQVFLKERITLLQQGLQGTSLSRDLKKIGKQAFYYKQQVSEFKEIIKNPSKIERKALELLSKSDAFQAFMQKNSQLAALFPMPGTGEAASASIQGLQTRTQINALLQERFGAGTDVTSMLQENVRDAQGQLADLRNVAAKYTNGAVGNGGSDLEMPKGFRPNNQKTKSFLNRLEYGINVQNQRARHYFPVTSDLGLSLGYKLNDNSVLGVGAAYKVGWGKGWDKISISHQGVGLRSFLDWRLKGSVFVSGGYELNYRSVFHSVDVLKNYSAWQKSGLIGLSKKYSVSNKVQGTVQLLWDFLSYQQVPRTQAIIWRVGYRLK